MLRRWRTATRAVTWGGAIVLAGVALSGCARVRAKTLPDLPALDVPVPPPHVVDVVEVEVPPPPPPPVPEPPPGPPPRPAEPGRSGRGRPEPRAEAPRPDPSVEGARSGEAQRPSAVGTLQISPAGSDGEAERQIRVTLQRASANLARVDYRALGADARTQYDTAKRFVQQADDAVRGKNLIFARNLADKAAALAGQLAGR